MGFIIEPKNEEGTWSKCGHIRDSKNTTFGLRDTTVVAYCIQCAKEYEKNSGQPFQP